MRILLFILLSFYSYGQIPLVTSTQGVEQPPPPPPGPEPPPVGTYTVKKTGLDSNPGTEASPFLTIQKCADVVQDGESCVIYAGRYPETVTPANSGASGDTIYFIAAEPGVIISGTEIIPNTGWTVHSGSIYKKTITLPVDGYDITTTGNTDILANQLFRNGVMMPEARWPNTVVNPEDMLVKSKMFRPLPATQTTNTLTDSGLPAISGGWTGAKIIIQGWYILHTNDVTGNSGTTITYSPGISDIRRKEYYYLTGKLGALDVAKEWHYESGTLYFFQEGGGTPSGTIEYKARNYGFVLTGRSFIKIQGLEFFACDPVWTTNTTGTNNTIDGIKAIYMNHAVLSIDPAASFQNDFLYYNSEQSGLRLIGANSIIKNSELQYCASTAIHLGANCISDNNLIHHVGYSGAWGAGIMMHGATSGGQKVLRNTIYRAGRSCVDYGWYLDGEHFNMELAYNDWYEFGCLSNDLGASYAGHYIRTTGSRIHHNWIHDMQNSQHSTGINTAIYWDQASGSCQIDHNVCYNNTQGDMYCQIVYEGRNAGSSLIANNVFATTSTWVTSHSYKGATGEVLDVQRNNIYRQDIIIRPSNPVAPNVANSLLEGTNPLFVGSGDGGLFYRTNAGPARNAGTVIPGVTDNAVGTPDIGAYEEGESWTAGYNSVLPDPIPPPPDDEEEEEILRVEAEQFTDRLGVTNQGTYIGSTNVGDWVSYTRDFGATKNTIGMRYARGTGGNGIAEIRLGSVGGTLIGTLTLPFTGGWGVFSTDYSTTISDLAGTNTIFIVFPASSNDGGDFDYFEFMTE